MTNIGTRRATDTCQTWESNGSKLASIIWYFDQKLVGMKINEISGREQTLGSISENEYGSVFTYEKQPVGFYGDVDGGAIISAGFIMYTCNNEAHNQTQELIQTESN